MNYIKNFVNFTRTFIILPIIAAMLTVSAASAAADDEAEFLKAAFSGQPENLKQLLDKGVNVNYQNDKGFSALIVASQYGHADNVNLLLEKNADVNLKNAGGATALIIAA